MAFEYTCTCDYCGKYADKAADTLINERWFVVILPGDWIVDQVKHCFCSAVCRFKYHDGQTSEYMERLQDSTDFGV